MITVSHDSIRYKELLIDGAWRGATSGKTIDDINPATGETLATVAAAQPEDVDAAVRAAKRAFTSTSWAHINPTERGRVIYQIARLIREHLEELARLEAQDAGKLLSDARDEMEFCASIFDYYAGAADKVLGEMYEAGPDKLGYVRREPYGVVAAITPWNYPLTEQVQKVAPALTMGNTVVVKPPEDAPLTGLYFGQLALEAGLPPGVLNVIPGIGNIAGEALIHHPDVALIVFTGSTEVGKRIMRVAADRIAKVELELGGKSPQLVFPDADLDDAIVGIALGLFKMAGQDCCAGTRILVHRDIVSEVVDRLKAVAEAQKLGNPLENTVTMGPLISQRQRERVHDYTLSAESDGATLVTGGCSVTEGMPPGSSFYAPTLFTNVGPTTRIFQEEVFGPVGVIIPFEHEDEAIALANATKYGLAGAVWTNDLSTALRVAQRIESGMVWINEYYGHLMQLPFGGFKQSGIGRDYSLHALDTYSQLKEITVRLGPKRF